MAQIERLSINISFFSQPAECRLEAWNIDSTTVLEQVDCLYVFLLEHTNSKGSRERRPHDPDKFFQPGDFAKLYKKIMNTVQLLMRNGVNPEAFRHAFEELMKENSGITYDSIQAFEKKGNDVLMTLEVPEETDKGQVERQFTEVYEARLEEAKQIALIEARHANDLKEIALALANYKTVNPIFNIKSEAKAMNESTDKKGDIYNQSGNIGIGHMSGGEIKDNAKVAGVINEAEKQNLADATTEIQTLLEQLSKTYPITTSKEKNIVIGEAVDQIENNPTLKAKVINALKGGGTEAFKEAIDHPLVNILVATIEGWQDAE